MVLPIGAPAPALAGTDVQTGAPFSLADWKGKTVLVGFNGLSWCGPCQYEAPILQGIWEQWQTNPKVEFVLVSTADASVTSTKNAISAFGLTMPVLSDPDDPNLPGMFGPMCAAWQVTAVPTLYVVEPDGTICNSKVGTEHPPAALEATLNELISACVPQTSPIARLDIHRFSEAVRILFGVIQDGGGRVLGPRGPVPIDPWGPLLASTAAQKVAMAVFLHEQAAAITDPGRRAEAQQLALGNLDAAVNALRTQSIAPATLLMTGPRAPRPGPVTKTATKRTPAAKRAPAKKPR